MVYTLHGWWLQDDQNTPGKFTQLRGKSWAVTVVNHSGDVEERSSGTNEEANFGKGKDASNDSEDTHAGKGAKSNSAKQNILIPGNPRRNIRGRGH